jgi:hypothetical protein
LGAAQFKIGRRDLRRKSYLYAPDVERGSGCVGHGGAARAAQPSKQVRLPRDANTGVHERHRPTGDRGRFARA